MHRKKACINPLEPLFFNMMQSGEHIQLGEYRLRLEKLLGKGKSGYSWLAEHAGKAYVLKALHNEPNPYYHFDKSKLEHELDAYAVLKETSIAIPELLTVDVERDLLLKEYVPGKVAAEVIAAGELADEIMLQLIAAFHAARGQQINLDYFPMNFVINPSGRLLYIDYEINPYTNEWNLWNWGIYYWLNSDGMRRFIDTGDPACININAGSGVPVKTGMEERVTEWQRRCEIERSEYEQ